MAKEIEKFRKNLIKTGGSNYLIIPAKWLNLQAKRLGEAEVEKLDIYTYDDRLIIAAVKAGKSGKQR